MLLLAVAVACTAPPGRTLEEITPVPYVIVIGRVVAVNVSQSSSGEPADTAIIEVLRVNRSNANNCARFGCANVTPGDMINEYFSLSARPAKIISLPANVTRNGRTVQYSFPSNEGGFIGWQNGYATYNSYSGGMVETVTTLPGFKAGNVITFQLNGIGSSVAEYSVLS